MTGGSDLPSDQLSCIDVDQFYGIELGEFPARIAETALWMMDHIMNNRLSLEFGQTFARIPLEKSPHIVHGDALETDWSELLPPGECSFVLGNPPFVGAKYQTTEQRAQVRGIAGLGTSGGTLDYVAAWFVKAGEYVKGRRCPDRVRRDQFDHAGASKSRSYGRSCSGAASWRSRSRTGPLPGGSDARGKAHVHVVILGLDRRGGCTSREAAVQLSRHPRRGGGKSSRSAVAVPVRRGRAVGPASGGAGRRRADQWIAAASHRLAAN